MLIESEARLKALFTLWVQLNGHLNIVDRLSRCGFDMEKKCQMCNDALETKEHLFLEYEFARNLREIQQWLK